MNIPLLLRRSQAGFGVLAIISACVIPIFAMVATEHRDHWTGAVGADFWGTFVAPWSGRIWGLVGVILLGGWSAGAMPSTVIRGHGVAGGALLGIVGASVYLLASFPSWVWMVRLGGVAAEQVGILVLWSWAPVVICGAAAGILCRIVGHAGGAMGGGLSGGALLWAVWGGMG